MSAIWSSGVTVRCVLANVTMLKPDSTQVRAYSPPIHINGPISGNQPGRLAVTVRHAPTNRGM
ncbi:MAG: hypothetical protein QM811_30265 [Pirellulales bacterium]